MLINYKKLMIVYIVESNDNCNVIDGKTVLFSYYTSSHTDNASS